MVKLGPEFCLIGSTPESTRLWLVSEIDVNNSLKGLKSNFFRISKWQLELEEPGVKYFGNFNFSVKLTIWETAVNNHTYYTPNRKVYYKLVSLKMLLVQMISSF